MTENGCRSEGFGEERSRLGNSGLNRLERPRPRPTRVLSLPVGSDDSFDRPGDAGVALSMCLDDRSVKATQCGASAGTSVPGALSTRQMFTRGLCVESYA